MILRLVFAAVLCYAGIVAIVYCVQARLLYMPMREIEMTPAAAGLDFEDVRFQASDGTPLHGWYVPCVNARATILFCHGNAGNISHRLDSLLIFNRLGLNVFIFDYRGYGMSGGKPSERGTEMDARAAWQWLRSVRGCDPERLIVFGRSLGGAVAAGLACERPCAAVILESAFISYADMGRVHYPWLPVGLIARYRYATREKARRLSVPVLIVHSPDDEIVPFGHGRAIYDACPEPRSFLEIGGGHNEGFLLSGQAYLQGLERFISSVAP